MTNSTLSILALVFLIPTLIMSITNYGKDVVDTYERCDLCIKNNVEYNCDCEIVIKYGDTPQIWWIVWGTGVGLLILSFIVPK